MNCSPSPRRITSYNVCYTKLLRETTPLPGIGIERDRVPANVQRIEAPAAAPVVGAMTRELNGVSVNENQGNPYQADLNFRGFTASPLLGTPQGLSVYVDGIRVNEGFGDVVNWDLIPQSALQDVTIRHNFV